MKTINKNNLGIGDRLIEVYNIIIKARILRGFATADLFDLIYFRFDLFDLFECPHCRISSIKNCI